MRTSQEVEAEVEASRNDLDRNVEALKQKMTPGQLFDEAARLMGGTGQQVASKFADQAKENPMPLAVMGLGLAWLMMSNNRRSTTFGAGDRGYGLSEPRSFGTTPYEDASGGFAEGLKEKAQTLGHKAHDVASGVQDKLAGARDSVASTRHAAGEKLGSLAGSVRERAGYVGHQAQRTFSDTLESEPLLLAGIGLFVGAAIGVSLPHTDAEDRLLGGARDRIVGKGKDMAQTGLEKASTAAHATLDAVKEELKADDERDTADRLADATRTGVQAAKDALRPSH